MRAIRAWSSGCSIIADDLVPPKELDVFSRSVTILYGVEK